MADNWCSANGGAIDHFLNPALELKALEILRLRGDIWSSSCIYIKPHCHLLNFRAFES